MNVKTKNKKVDIVYVNLEFSDDSKSTYSFEQLLNNSEINEKEFSIKFKNIKLKKYSRLHSLCNPSKKNLVQSKFLLLNFYFQISI